MGFRFVGHLFLSSSRPMDTNERRVIFFDRLLANPPKLDRPFSHFLQPREKV
jgi:hypothetical protein